MTDPILRYPLLDHGYVEFIEHWGSDEQIVEAARMSTGKGFKGWGPWVCKCRRDPEPAQQGDIIPVPQRIKDPDPACTVCGGNGNAPGDEKFLRFLYENKHMSPFEQAGMTVEVQAPIFIFREWHRHRTQSYNEMSGRYTVLPDLYYVPSVERIMAGRQSQTKKQGADPTTPFPAAVARAMQDGYLAAYKGTRDIYEMLILEGVERGLARLVLPVAQYSRMRASANLRNWLQFLTLRMAPDSNWEIRQYANVIGKLAATYFPRVWQLFSEGA